MNYRIKVLKEIQKDNKWYTSSQFKWAREDSVKRIYKKRYLFFNGVIKKEIRRKRRIILLDYGCGDGYWSMIFSAVRGCKVTGVDYNPERLKKARALIKNAVFKESDLTRENKKLGKYDIILCSQVIEHVKDDLKFLKIIKQHLKKDGILILGTTNEGCMTQKFRNLYTNAETDHVHFYKEKEIRLKIQKAGFEVKNIYREVFYPGFDRIYYKLTSSDFGFKLLELLTRIFPSQCSDYYFECKIYK